MGNKGATRPDQQEDNSESPSGRVHWINYATFFLSVTLAILTAGTIRVYYLQLNQMIIATNATQDAAYDACISAKIARQTLLEYQSGEADSHSIAAGTVAQASVAIREQSGFLSLSVGREASIAVQPGSNPSSLMETAKEWKTLDLAFTYGVTGKSSIRNARIKYTVQALSHGTEPNPTDNKLYSDTIRASVLNPGNLTMQRPTRIIDHNNKPINADDVVMDDFRSGKLYIASFGRADYTDIFGVGHWQTFCGYFDNFPTEFEGGIAQLKHVKCADYNRQDSNLLYPVPQFGPSTNLPSAVENIVCTAPKH
jgi:hypothetical protein